MPELKHIALGLIDEPALPMRATMNEENMLSLMNSIVQIGQQLPVQLREQNGRYQIITGHRRFIAMQKLGRETIMSLVLKPGEDMGLAAMIAENSEREEVNRAEEALWLAQICDEHNATEEQLCALVKRSPDYVADSFRLLRNDEQVFRAVLEGKINFSVARELNKCTDEPMRRNYLDQAIRSGTSARVVTDWVKNWKINTGGAPTVIVQPQPSTDPAPAPAYVMACALCGGDKDPYNLITIQIHKWEWEHIQRLVREAAKVDG